MKFYIVTPAFNALQWLPQCVRSVQDQVGDGVTVHHHVQDGGSVDGSAEWLSKWALTQVNRPGYTFSYESVKDDGMYDAINKAWSSMPEEAEVTAHLNADEQYLPGVLGQVADWHRLRPDADILLGTYIIVDAKNNYICHRRPVVPRSWSSHLTCTCITNSAFYRVQAFRRLGVRFDSRWKCQGDLVFFRELTLRQAKFVTVPLVTSLFVCTGSNLAWTEKAHQEWLELCAEYPRWFCWANEVIYRWVNLKRRIVNLFLPAPHGYEVYVEGAESRRYYPIERPTVIWRGR